MVSDSNGGTINANQSFSLAPVNDAPVVSGRVNLGAIDEGNKLLISSDQLLFKASDVDGDSLSVSNVQVIKGQGSINTDLNYTFERQILKANATFSFDRYICGESSSLARDLGRAFNEIFGLSNPIKDGGSVAYSTNIINQDAFGVIRGLSNTDNPYRGAGSNNSNSPNGPTQTLGGTSLGAGQIIS